MIFVRGRVAPVTELGLEYTTVPGTWIAMQCLLAGFPHVR